MKRAIVLPLYDHTTKEEIRDILDAMDRIGLNDMFVIDENTLAFMHLVDPNYGKK